jgi:hypothetical protein
MCDESNEWWEDRLPTRKPLPLNPDCKGIDIRQGQNGLSAVTAEMLGVKQNMTKKTAIVAHLGESAVLLPQLLSWALDANDRAKLRMTVPHSGC